MVLTIKLHTYYHLITEEIITLLPVANNTVSLTILNETLVLCSNYPKLKGAQPRGSFRFLKVFSRRI